MTKPVKISLIISVLFFIGIFVPYFTPWAESDNCYAISAGFIFIFILGIVSFFVYRRMGKQETLVKSGEKLIAHWFYTDQEWKDFTETENKLNKSEKKMLFFIIAGFALLFGVIFFIADPEGGIFVVYAMLALIVIIAVTALLSTKLAHMKNLRSKGEAYISLDGVIINGTFHAWTLYGNRFESVTFARESIPKYLEFTYSIVARHGRQNQTVRLPVPHKEEKNVPSIIETLESGAR